MASAARSRWILATVLVTSIGVAWWVRRRPPQYDSAYIGDHAATLWTTTAQVRQEVGTLGYGEKVSVIRQSGDQVQVRTAGGTQGWVDAHLLMSPGMWDQVANLLARARSMPPQALGHTRALSNVHASPGRDAPRIFQFGRNVPVFVLERSAVAVPPTGGAPAEQADAASSGKQEDWLFVLRADAVNAPATPAVNVTPVRAVGVAAAAGTANTALAAGMDSPVAGWVLARFVELDPPQPIADYASSAAMRIIGWQVLNNVPDAAGERPQYLVAGVHGGEGQDCDFSSLRVYTWATRAQRYETAYIENNLCGKLPIEVQHSGDGVAFQFADPENANAPRVYVMKQTVVRRVKSEDERGTRSGKAR